MLFPSGGGFELCADGSVRRPQPADCVTAVPRSEPAAGRIYEECEYDADCTEKPHGYCALGSCFYGCVSDSDCGEHQVCACGEPIGTCQVGCLDDAACSPGYPCIGVSNAGRIQELFCQPPYDECVSDDDCNEFDPRMRCVTDAEAAGRRCVRRIVG